MDLAQERKRLQALDEYGVKTTRQWNAYYAEWERQHPVRARVNRIVGNILLYGFTALFWAVMVASPIIAITKGFFSGS